MGLLASPTIEDLLLNVRNMLNQPDAENSFWSDDELIVYLNEAVRRYFAEVVLNMEGHFTTTANLDLVGGTNTVALPTDCFDVKALYRPVQDGYELLAYNNTVTDGYSNTSSAGSGDIYLPSYKFRGNSLVLDPPPQASETAGLQLEYVQFPETLVNGGDSLTAQVSPVFKDMIEMYAVWKAKIKESLVNGVNTSTLAKQNLEDLYVAFQNAMNSRSKYPTYTTPFNPERA